MCLGDFISRKGLDTLSSDGLEAEFFFRSADATDELLLFRIPLKPGQSDEIVATFELRQLEGRRGHVGIRCTPGPLGDPISDWLAILQSVVGREDRLGLLNGRANRTWRTTNEIAHFNTAYEHPIYADRATNPDDAGASTTTIAAQWSNEAPSEHREHSPIPTCSPPLTADDLIELPAAGVRIGDDVFHYSNRLLVELIAGGNSIDFAGRLKTLAITDRPLRFLTLCSGAAGIERGLLAEASIPVEITLFDINEKLMEQAAKALAPFGRVRRILGDVNQISAAQFDRDFDVIACVSGLHHVVELERVLQNIARLLTGDGEFWMIGEQIGRNGNRLWPEAAEVANALFSRLPDLLRRNSYTGAVDTTIPDIDFSASSFEGVRSAEIEPLLQAYFEPVQLSRGNCFLWRLFEPTYYANYDLTNETHQRIVLGFVAAEYNLWNKGGRPTQCFGVYRRNTQSRVGLSGTTSYRSGMTRTNA